MTMNISRQGLGDGPPRDQRSLRLTGEASDKGKPSLDDAAMPKPPINRGSRCRTTPAMPLNNSDASN